MKKKYLVLVVLFAAAFFVPYNAQAQAAEIFRQEGIASWYGKEFEGRPTASGEIFDSSQLTAAHPSLPFGTMVVVTNRHNNKKVTVRVNDRGPFVAARIIDVSRAAAEQLDMIVTGTAPVQVESVEKIAFTAPVAPTPPAAPATPPAASPAPIAPVTPTPVQPQVVQAPPINNALPDPVIPLPVTEAPPVVQTPAAPPVVAYPPAPVPNAAPSDPAVKVAPPLPVQASYQLKLKPEINIDRNKIYRLQVGSYKVARNAVDTFERLKNAGLNPAYEKYSDDSSEYFRVVLAGVRGNDVQLTAERLGAAGFSEALIREER
jgi:rare lipoprotein A